MAMRSPLMIAGSSCMSDENGGGKLDLKAEEISNSHPEKIMNGLGTCSQTSKGSLKISEYQFKMKHQHSFVFPCSHISY